MELIQPKGSVIKTKKRIQFQWKDDPYFKGTFNGGATFDVNEYGEIIFHNKYQKESYEKCLISDDYINLGIHEEKIYSDFNLWKCDCGEEFYITNNLGNECPKCEQKYNYFGQKIVSYYGTGEDW